jgi:hypothetical protein
MRFAPVVALTYRATVDVPALRRRDDAGDALRSCAEHAAFEEMVLAQGLGYANRQAPRNEEGDRGPGASIGRDHASHLG